MRRQVLAVASLLALAGTAAGQAGQQGNWPGVGNDPGCQRYSELDQINRDNVTRLKPAWTYHSGELAGRTPGGPERGCLHAGQGLVARAHALESRNASAHRREAGAACISTSG